MSSSVLFLALAAASVQASPSAPGAVVTSASARVEIVTLEPVRPPPPRSDQPQLQRRVDRATATIEFY